MTQTEINITPIVAAVNGAIEDVVNGFASKYLKFTLHEGTENERDITIRVSNHNANPRRCDNDTYSIVVNVPDKDTNEDDQYCSLCINKKSFIFIPNQIVVDVDGYDPDGRDIEWNIDYWFN